MIHLTKDQPLKDRPELRVIAPTGTYDEIDLIECYHEKDPSKSVCMFQAQFIKFGGAVYQQDDVLTDKQVEALLAGAPAEQVINNKSLIEGFRKTVRQGKIVGKNGTVLEQPLPDNYREEVQQPRVEEPRPDQEERTAQPSAPFVPPPPKVDIASSTPAISGGATNTGSDTLSPEKPIDVPPTVMEEKKIEVLDAVLEAVPAAADPSVSVKTKLNKLAKVAKAVRTNTKKKRA